MTFSHALSVGRIAVVNVQPSLEEGRWAAKAVVGEAVQISAQVFREGHDKEGATVSVTLPDGSTVALPMALRSYGTSEYEAVFIPASEGFHHFVVEGWSDPVGTWQHAASTKIAAGVDVQLMLEEGITVVTRAIQDVKRPAADQRILK